ncbi:type IV toxin-antitoxin system AbiEi family antitoxin domain-containing protein [Nocardioides halotolerans]|uniref:type IV toxin-antitoxin system AbiEi family antitoxin domain-containing protein n=1 Tax=Nocardioides halotolerans TaxID=433660 RepID=UPI000414A48C|nr:type IV toxin-antitoxin system AbiEi family antitoxin domain-containing protein [Nocardioides halotolerans]
MKNAKARAIMAANHGLITRTQALDAGLSPLDIRHLLHAGILVVVRRGVYADAEIWNALDEHVGRPRLQTRAALATMRRAWVVSHDSAAHEHGLEVLRPPDPHVHITRPGTTGAWTKFGVKHHLARFRDEQVVEASELRVLDLARTAVDIAREHGTPYGEVACDSAMRMGVTRAALEEAVAPMTYWPYSRAARAAVDFADPRAESLLETLARILVKALSVGDVDLQFPVEVDDGRVIWGDIRVGRHIFEAHGKIKYLPPSLGGVAHRAAAEVVWDEKKRERKLHRQGLGTSSILFEDYWNPRRNEVLARMRAEYDDTVARFGTELPEHLVRNARELRSRFGVRRLRGA